MYDLTFFTLLSPGLVTIFLPNIVNLYESKVMVNTEPSFIKTENVVAEVQICFGVNIYM